MQLSLAPPMSRRERLWGEYGRKCHWCRCETSITSSVVPNQATVDHVIPRGKGGPDNLDNVVSACLACNQRRNKECMLGLPEGYLLKNKAPITTASVVRKLQKSELEVLRESRDQALVRIGQMANTLAHAEAENARLRREMEKMTVRRFLARRLVRWLER